MITWLTKPLAQRPLGAPLLALTLSACGPSTPDMGEGTAPDLADTDWLLVSAEGADQVAGGKITFAGDGSVSGNSGCNAFQGGYTLDGGALSFGPMAMTRKACGSVADATERAFMAAIGATTGAASIGSDLLLIDAQDRPIARLTPL